MPTLTIYHLTFPHGIHIGRGGVESVEESLDYAPSDTLFAALLDTWVHLGRDAQEILSPNGSPAFRVTSAFPFVGGVRFYPRPVDLRALFSDETLKVESAGKRIKKIRYISEQLLEQAADGQKLDDLLFPEDDDKDPKDGVALQGGAFWLLTQEVSNLPEAICRYTEEKNGQKEVKDRPLRALCRQTVSATQTAPRVTVDRMSSVSNLFESQRAIFREGCGLWFGAVGQVSSLASILPVLGESGLGGERTAGYGHFTFTGPVTRSFATPTAGPSYLLNRWHPASGAEIAMLRNDASAYKLDPVSGWLRTPERAATQRRKRIWMVAEGSLIAGNPQGDAPDVRPEYDAKNGETISHPIYRAGFAVALDWKRR